MIETDTKKLAFAKKSSAVTAIADSSNFISIFLHFLIEGGKELLEKTTRFAFFPFATFMSAIQVCLAWWQAQLQGWKKGALTRACVETLAFLAIGTAVIGGFVAASVFALAAPIIFTATLGAKTLFHLGSALYYWGKSTTTADLDKKANYSNLAKMNLVAGVSGSLATVAVYFVMIAAAPALAIAGVVASAIGIVECTLNLIVKKGLVDCAIGMARSFLNLFKSKPTVAKTDRAIVEEKASLSGDQVTAPYERRSLSSDARVGLSLSGAVNEHKVKSESKPGSRTTSAVSNASSDVGVYDTMARPPKARVFSNPQVAAPQKTTEVPGKQVIPETKECLSKRIPSRRVSKRTESCPVVRRHGAR